MIAPLAVYGVGQVASVTPSGEATKLDLTVLERTLRRGLSDTTRLFMHAAHLALSTAGVGPERLHVIFASAFGEIATAEALLREAFDANGSSPARFRNSVHNTTTGLFSISNKNQLPSTAIAAGWDTVAMALYEASAQLAAEADRVLLVFAEESVPVVLSDEHSYRGLAAAFVLGPVSGGPRAQLANLRREPRPLAAVAHDPHPIGPAIALAHAIEAAQARTIVVGEGPEPYCVDVQIEVPREAP